MSAVSQRLLPLFIADFFAGMMFFYPVTFPYMHHLKFTAAQIGLYVIISNFVVLAVEVPSGILADRWSRKGAIMLGTVFLTIGTICFGFAHNFRGIILGDLFCSIYWAVRSGMLEAMIYDSLLEADDRENYEKQLGKLRAINTTGLVISSLIGAVVAASISFSAPFFMSTLSCVPILFFLARFREPKLHRQIESTKLLKHIGDLFLALGHQREVRLLVITSILVGIEYNAMLQIDPLWPIALGLATAWYGPLNAFLLSSQGVAGFLAAKASRSNRRLNLVSLGLIVGAVGLLIRNIYLIAFSEFFLLAMATVLMIVLSGRIQDQLPSSQRSGVGSAISTLALVAFVLTVIAFTHLSQRLSVFAASWILVAVAGAGAWGVRVSQRSTPRVTS